MQLIGEAIDENFSLLVFARFFNIKRYPVGRNQVKAERKLNCFETTKKEKNVVGGGLLKRIKRLWLCVNNVPRILLGHFSLHYVNEAVDLGC